LDGHRRSRLSGVANVHVPFGIPVNIRPCCRFRFVANALISNLGYEFFKISHFLAVVIFMLTFFWHCDYTLTSWHYFIATAAVYVPCFVYPWLRTVLEYKCTQQAHIFVEDNGFTRITIPAKFHWTPGQHCFLRFTGFGVLQAISTHPFTICSSPPRSKDEPSELVFYIRHQNGFTAKLHQHALDHPDGVSVPVVIDGPYGGASSPRLRDADHLLVLAGGSGAGWCLPFIESFIQSAFTPGDEDQEHGAPAERRTAYRQSSRHTSLRVVLTTRDTSSRIWFERTVDALLAKYPPSTVSSSIRVQVFLTGQAADQADLTSKTPHQTQSKTSSDEKIIDPEKGLATAVPGSEFDRRPRLPAIVQEETAKAASAGESLNVYVCGPTTMQNDVRNAVASENLNILSGTRTGSVYLHSEHFEWA
jgi:NAD(P)H-flavin reductase